MKPSSRAATWKRIIAFLLLTAILSAVVQVAIVRGGGLNQSAWLVGLLMWCPGIAAIGLQLVARRTLAGMGWKLPSWRIAALAYFLPIAYALPVYALVWSSGIAHLVSPATMQALVAGWGMPTDMLWVIPVHAALVGSIGVLSGVVFALGEEIGWRGFLVPELSRVHSFQATALISGLIWAGWHYPILIFADYNGGVPIWFAIPCFTVAVTGIAVVMAWMRLRTGSFWPAVILHASHNSWIQEFFTPSTGESTNAKYLIDEFGIGLALSCAVVGWIFWRRGSALRESRPTAS